jgi:hypothetical protein
MRQAGSMQLPGPLRAAIGFAANLADEARHLPDRAIELPMLAVSSALQMSLRAQQRYAMLAARGDEVLSGGRTSDEPPAWATFDDPVGADELRRLAQAADVGGPDASAILDEIFGSAHDDPGTSDTDAVEQPLTPPTPITRAATRKAAASTASGTTASGSTATAKAAAKAAKAAGKTPKKAATTTSGTKRAAKAAGTKAAVTKAAGTKAAGTKAAARSATPEDTPAGTSTTSGKGVPKPRHTTPSKFDDAGD